MTDDDASELRELRARAYGPAADISRDAEALSRLIELEQHASNPTRKPAEAAAPPGRSADDADGIEEPAAEPDQSAPTTEAAQLPPTGEPHRWALGRNTMYVGIGIFTATVAAAVALTATATTTAPLYSETRHETTLTVDPSFSWSMFPDENTRGFTEYLGLTVVATHWEDEDAAATECLDLYLTARIVSESNSYSGTAFSGCGSGSFPAAVVVPIDQSLPESLRQTFPNDTALQFVLHGSTIDVYSDAEWTN